MATQFFHKLARCGAVLGLLGLHSGCERKAGEAAPPPPEVEVVTVEQRDVPIYREWVGTLEGEVNATISAQVSGYLLSRNYVEGSVVTNGQLLFQIDPGPFKATLDQAKSDVAQAQATETRWALTAQRYKPLAAVEAISQQELDDAVQNQKAAQAHVEAAQAAVESAQLNLGFTAIRSPVNGVAGLATAQAQIGNLVGPNSGTLTTVMTTDPIRVYASVSQRVITEIMEKRVAEGKPVDSSAETPLELILTTGTAYPQKGKLRFKNNQVDVRTGTVRVVGEFPNAQSLLIPGMFVNVRALLTTQTNALLVPQRAVIAMQSRYLVAVVGADNKASLRPVMTGERVGEEWVISGNIKAGERVIAEGMQRVRDGAVVSPVPFKEKVAAAPAAKAEERK